MRAQRDVCLFCRHLTKSRPLSTTTRRSASTRYIEPYVLPRLVIDLDAADSKVVRRAEDVLEGKGQEVEAERKKKIARVPVLDRINMKRRKLAQLKPKVALKTVSTFPPDLLSFALAGEGPKSTKNKINYVHQILGFSMVQPEVSVDTKTQALLHNFTIDADENLKRAGLIKEHEKAIAFELRNCRSFSKLHRMVSLLSSTHNGCVFLANHGWSVAEGIRITRKAQDESNPVEAVSVSMVLHLINNLHRSMHSKDLEIGAALCNTGLYYASKAMVLPALKMYLESAWKNRYKPDWRAASAIVSSCKALKSDASLSAIEPLRRTEMLKLLTGWEGAKRPDKAGHISVCFAFLMLNDSNLNYLHSLYPSYIIALGELGLKDTLWRTWESSEAAIPDMFRGITRLRYRAQLFATAFLLVKDSKRAISILSSVPEDHQDEPFLGDEPPAEKWLPSRFDKMAPLSSKYWMPALLFDHYRFNNFTPTEKLRKLVWDTFATMPEEPRQIVAALSKILSTDCQRHPNAEVVDLDWCEHAGQEGLFAKSGQETTPVYWKPAKPEAL